MNIFIFNKALRIQDNTTLIYLIKNYGNVIPIFIFTEQVNQKKNKYFSNNSVQFMVESLHELSTEIEKHNGKLYFFHYDDLIKVLKNLNTITKIDIIGTNIDYSPYAKRREQLINKFCYDNNIKFIAKEDHVMYNILDNLTLKKDGTPYTVYTPFKNHCLKNLKVSIPNKCKIFLFDKNHKIEESKYYINDIDKFYEYNENPHVQGGRSYGLKILKNINKFKDYDKQRDYLNYNTTFLSAYNHFGVISIREVYAVMKKYKLYGLIRQLIWRDFYYNLYYHFPHMLAGQIGNINDLSTTNNKAFRPKFDKINWSYDKVLFKKWCDGTLGIPICDAGMIQLNTTGFMHNRLRMICANVLTKLLLIDWRWGEKYFAQKLLDYDSTMNNSGWQWICCGIDPKQAFRIFSPQLQSKKFDKDCIFIKHYIPELQEVPNIDVHEWETEYVKYTHINYNNPCINYKKAREHAIKEYKKIN
jgi:deoxyribodipyrimidine photo-lyase